MNSKKCLMVSLFLAVLPWPAFAQLSSIEQQIADQVDSDIPQALSLLEELVNINSGTMNFDGVRQVGALLQAEFDELGFRTQWLPGEAFNRAGHLYAEYGTTGPRILLIGHLDTVFAQYDAFRPINQSMPRTQPDPVLQT